MVIGQYSGGPSCPKTGQSVAHGWSPVDCDDNDGCASFWAGATTPERVAAATTLASAEDCLGATGRWAHTRPPMVPPIRSRASEAVRIFLSHMVLRTPL